MSQRKLYMPRLYGTFLGNRVPLAYSTYQQDDRVEYQLTRSKSCISEAQKYQGALYRPEKEKRSKQNNNTRELVPHKAYVEDAYEDYENYENYEKYEDHNSHITIVEPPGSAPSPPSAAPGFDIPNVFDFLVQSETPNASRLEFSALEPMPMPMIMIEDVPELCEPQIQDLVRVRFEETNESVTNFIEYGNGPVPSNIYETPAPKAERERKKERKERDALREEKKERDALREEKKERDAHREEKKERDAHREEKKDKKRKRLHVETHDLKPRGGDEVMTDAPPVLHSGLTGGLNRLLSRPSVFPPSPDYSGDAGEPSPGSPLKKTKHSTKRGRSISNNLMSLIANPMGSSREQSREHSEDRPRRKHRKHREDSERPSRKMIEYLPQNGDGAVKVADEEVQNQMVVYQPRAETLLGFINKGPESERGLSMNKALKRYHRERAATGSTLSRAEEEKELWKSLRMKRNEVGEIVLFL